MHHFFGARAPSVSEVPQRVSTPGHSTGASLVRQAAAGDSTAASRVPQGKAALKRGGAAKAAAPLSTEEMMTETLVSRLRAAAHAYYETDDPLMTDAEYDELLEKLRKRAPTHAFFNEVGATPSVGRVPLPVPMPSLRKLKPDTLSSWKAKGPFVITEKLDGISALWVNGFQPKLYLRGNGLVGQDVSHVLPYIQGARIGTLGSGVVRGELILPRKEVTDTLARNYVNGLLHQSSPSAEDLRSIHFVAYQVLEPKGLTRSQQITWLQNQGFKVAWHTTAAALSAAPLEAMFRSRRTDSDYECDGIVIGTDTVPEIRTDADLPKDQVAFKVAVADQRAETTVRAVEWSVSRHGHWIPRICFDPVKIGTATIEACTGVHYGFIQQFYINVGAKIVVRRSGDVIPTLDQVLEPADVPATPPAGRYRVDGLHAMDTTVEATTETLAKELVHTLTTLGVEGVRQTSAEKLVEGGIRTAAVLYEASVEAVQKILGKANGEKLMTEFRSCASSASTQTWIHAYPGWPRGFGERKITTAIEWQPNVAQWPTTAGTPKSMSTEVLSEIVACVPKYLAWRTKFPVQSQIAVMMPPPEKTAVCPAKGQFVMTGFRDADLQKRLVEAGWRMQDRVTKDTTVLLVPEDAKETGKVKEARDKGVRIVCRKDVESLF